MQIYRWHRPSSMAKQPVTGPGRVQSVRRTMRYVSKEEEEENRRDQELLARQWSTRHGGKPKGSLLDKRI